MRVKLHGVRGSVPISSPSMLHYGGHTTSIEIDLGYQQIFCDTGTGFTKAQIEKKEVDPVFLFSHFHHDHIQALPFNESLLSGSVPCFLSSALAEGEALKMIFTDYFSGHYFPIPFFDIFSHIQCINFDAVQDRLAADTQIKTVSLNHPGGATGYSIATANHKICVLLDNEFIASQEQELAAFCADASVVIWDGMFTSKELEQKKGWGHSSIEQGISFAKDNAIDKLILTHHDPSRTDTQLAELEKKYASAKVSFAREDMDIELS